MCGNVFILSIFVIFTSCVRNSDKEVKLTNKHDEIVYSNLDYDTIIRDIDLNLYTEDYQLRLKRYSLNDSAVKNFIYQKNRDSEFDTILSVGHNYESQILLYQKSKTIFDISISKNIFQDSLEADFIENIMLDQVEYDYFRSNRIYFKAYLGIPNTDVCYKAEFAIFYQTQKSGQLDYWGVKAIEYK